MLRHHREQFRQQVVEHLLSHPDQSVAKISKLLGAGYSTLDKWMPVHRTRIGVAASAEVAPLV